MCNAYNLKVGNYKLLRELGLAKETILKAGGLRYKGECLGYFTKYYKYGYTDEDIKKAVRRGCDLYEIKQLPSVVKTDHKGVEYPTMTAMVEAYGKNITSVASRLKSGWSIKDALTKDIAKKSNEKVKDHLGNEYASKTEMAEAYGMALRTLELRLSSGLSLAGALTQRVPKRYKLKVEDHLGNKFQNVMEMCKFYGVKYDTYYQRLQRGWSKERALTTKV